MNSKKQKEELLKRISDLEKQVHGLENDLIYDWLTMLKTRAFFEEESDIYLKALSSVNKNRRREWFGFKNLSFLFFDIDHFKRINDTYGHDIGDVVLREVARTIVQSVRIGDTVARWGGEEMVVMLLGADKANAKNKAEEIRKKIEMLHFDSFPDLKVTISIGVAAAEEGIACRELISRADEAVYKAKDRGRNRVATY